MTKKLDMDSTASVAHKAAKYAMFTGAAVAGGQQAAVAQEQQTTASNIDEIVVTGSRIRRVDAETAVPIQIIDAEQIAETGVTTIGELIQKLPAIGGGATNPAVNNGGGDGASNVELRGLGAERTLVLLNGRRYGALGNGSSAVDINSIPVNMIERVEVLKQGAGAIYGSDAIGGVVNFITRKKADGATVSIGAGSSSESDGDRREVSLSWGTDNERGSLLMGLNYNQQDAISAGDREFSRNALYFYGSVFAGGSSRVPTGRIFLDSAAAIAAGLNALYGCNSVTRIAGTTGDSLDDFRCYVGSGPVNDSFNYQPFNLIMTPQERASVFTLASWNLSDDVEAYTEFLYNRTKSGFQIAPLPFDSRSDNVVISADSLYNPFGIDLGGVTDPLNSNATFRMVALGNRRNEVESWQGQITGGIRGALFDTGWDFDVNAGYARIDQNINTSGYLFKNALINALGPSYIDDGGNPVCGVDGGGGGPSTVISGCIPVNIFNLTDPTQLAALNTISASYNQSYKYSTKSVNAGVTGDVFELPAGKVSVAIGAEYRDSTHDFDTDFLTQASPPEFKDCLLQGETCSGDQFGTVDVKEAYLEALFPIAKDMPGIQSLNLTAGVRYSDYGYSDDESFDTTNFSFKIDWKITDELLARATFSEIFRAPTLIDKFQAPSASAETFTDPCVGLEQADLDDPSTFFELACENVDPDGTFDQPNSQVDALLVGSAFAGGNLQPEEGEAFTIGLVWEPSFIDGLSLAVDYWDYSLDNDITQPDPTYVADQCVATGNEFFCGLINRFSDGTIFQIVLPTVNFNTRDLSGIDFSAAYRLEDLPIGTLRFGLEATYNDKYESRVAATGALTEVAGYYDRQYGNIAEWRGQFLVGWEYADFEAQVITRYNDGVKVSDPDGAPGIQPDLNIASQTYIDMTAGYTIESWDTKIQVGVNNLGDNQPPILFQNNVLNANTDVSTYDTVGRYFFGSVVKQF
ncbi:MAG: TonB-dependent receptor [Gammaproteobacteria bacterium]|nr:TonB-dependent receptor [Gammaproteobacteria bacterium]